MHGWVGLVGNGGVKRSMRACRGTGRAHTRPWQTRLRGSRNTRDSTWPSPRTRASAPCRLDQGVPTRQCRCTRCVGTGGPHGPAAAQCIDLSIMLPAPHSAFKRFPAASTSALQRRRPPSPAPITAVLSGRLVLCLTHSTFRMPHAACRMPDKRRIPRGGGWLLCVFWRHDATGRGRARASWT